ncbi:MAG: hypothetical protein D6733_05635 [Methanobacteriota archaeon]|nr:MAG: hypothetical protein D6733_05635 [Euryarchaeota archaeon]
MNVVVDCGVCHNERGERIRVSISKSGSKHAVHRHTFFPQKGGTEVEFTGSLFDCIDYVERKYRHNMKKEFQEVKSR